MSDVLDIMFAEYVCNRHNLVSDDWKLLHHTQTHTCLERTTASFNGIESKIGGGSNSEVRMEIWLYSQGVSTPSECPSSMIEQEFV